MMLAASVFLIVTVLLPSSFPGADGLRCYVCGGHSGKACLPILDPEGDLNGDEEEEEEGGFFSSFSSRRSPYVRPPTPAPTDQSTRQWEECNDIINHKGCMKQVVNDGEFYYTVVVKDIWHQELDDLAAEAEEGPY